MTEPIKILSKKEFLKLNNKPDQEKVWDNVAKSVSKRDYFKIREISAVKDFLKNKKGIVIDLGCGAGWNMITNDNIVYYGADFSKESLELTRKRAEMKKINVKLIKGDVSRLDKKIFCDSMFDYGLFIAVLHCIETKEKRENSLKEFYRVLKPGAYGLISVWKSDDKRFDCVNNHGDIYMNWKINNKNNFRYYYLYEKKELIDLLKKTGFEIIEFCPVVEKERFSKKNWIIRVKKQK
jgi:ubiquinone/menaquinone biosynthesis C-methylase UbiE